MLYNFYEFFLPIRFMNGFFLYNVSIFFIVWHVRCGSIAQIFAINDSFDRGAFQPLGILFFLSRRLCDFIFPQWFPNIQTIEYDFCSIHRESSMFR